jgi:UDP-N-acetylmuramoyl-L-alanyl-D-glutamate--2,6-diaminopimelate ligase
MKTYSGTTVAAHMAGSGPSKVKREFAGIASDSREVAPGYLFAALQGTRADGASYLAEAVRRGATAVLGEPRLRGQVEALGVRFIADENPRRKLAEIAALYYSAQPSTVAAVTGTNGKTSVCVFLRQIWEFEGRRAASLGTIGLVTPFARTNLALTTPDAIALHRMLADLAQDDVQYLALEASSHGLDQFRLDAVRISAAAFTNITRDHLDYHRDFEAYLAAKLRLVREVVTDDGVVVVNADAMHAEEFVEAARTRGLRMVLVGVQGETIRLISRESVQEGQLLEVVCFGERRRVSLPLIGDFQASNALVAAGLAIGLGDPPARVFPALSHIKGAPGRLEKVAYSRTGAPVYVDYAHTPDAIETVLNAVRPHVAGRLRLIFGCGGNRDRGKRRVMGRIAAQLADYVIVTDDNPRFESADEIRREILEGCPAAAEIGDRAEAIRVGVAALEPGDALVIAGKGDESGQIVGETTRPFLDAEEAIRAARAEGGHVPGLEAFS